MLYCDFKLKEHEYKLRLSVREIVALEKDLGKNPLFVFTQQVPNTEDMVLILYHALKHYQPDTTLDNAYELFDKWIDEGHLLGEFAAICVEVYTISGLFKPKGEEDEKN